MISPAHTETETQNSKIRDPGLGLRFMERGNPARNFAGPRETRDPV